MSARLEPPPSPPGLSGFGLAEAWFSRTPGPLRRGLRRIPIFRRSAGVEPTVPAVLVFPSIPDVCGGRLGHPGGVPYFGDAGGGVRGPKPPLVPLCLPPGCSFDPGQANQSPPLAGGLSPGEMHLQQRPRPLPGSLFPLSQPQDYSDFLGNRMQ
jgi:hypothetical protein